MHYRVLLLSLLGSTAQVLGAPVLPTPTASTSLTSGDCQQYFAKNDHGDCFGRHCGPQNFPAGETPTHCAGEGKVQEKRHNVCRFIDGKLHCPKPVKPTGMITHVSRAVDNEAASPTAHPTPAADVLNETVSDMIVNHTALATTTDASSGVEHTTTTMTTVIGAPTVVPRAVNGSFWDLMDDLAEQMNLPKMFSDTALVTSTVNSEEMDTTITTTFTPTSAAPTAWEDLEKRHILCKRIHGKVLCGSKLRQHYNQHLSEVLSAAESLHHSTANASSTTSECIDTTTTTTVTPTSAAPTIADETGDLEKRRSLCRILDGGLYCDQYITQHLAEKSALESKQREAQATATHSSSLAKTNAVYKQTPTLTTGKIPQLEKRRNLCRMADGKVQCGKKSNHASTNQNMMIKANRTRQHDRSNPTIVNGTALFDDVDKLSKHALAAISNSTKAHMNSTIKAIEIEIDSLADDLLPAQRLPRSVSEDADCDTNVDLAVKTDADDTHGTIESRQYPHALPANVPTPGRDFLNWKREATTDEQGQHDDDDEPAQSDHLTFPNAPTDGKYPVILESDAPSVLPARLIVTSFDANEPIPTGEDLLFEEARHCKIKCDHNVTAGPDCYFDCMVNFKPSQLYEPVFLETVRTDNKIEPRSDISDETSAPVELLAVMAADSDEPIPTGGDRFIKQAEYCKQKCDHEILIGSADLTCYKECVTDFNPADLHEPMYFEPATDGKIQPRDEGEEDDTENDTEEKDIQTDVVVMAFDPSKPIPTGGDLYIEEAKWCKAKCDDEIASGTATAGLCYQDCVNDFDPARLRDPVYYESYADPAGLSMPENVDETNTEPEVTSTGP